jgi:hypothetical protein
MTSSLVFQGTESGQASASNGRIFLKDLFRIFFVIPIAQASIRLGFFRKARIVCVLDSTGLGSRLGSLLRGIALARVLGASFSFVWVNRDQDGIYSAEETFGRKMLQDYQLDFGRIHSRLVYDLRAPISFWSLAVLRLSGPSSVQLRLGRAHSRKGVLRTALAWRNPALGSLFSEITFAEDVEEMRALAGEFGLFDVAIHCRRGDLKRGLARIGGPYSAKIIPLPLLVEIVASIPATQRVLLVDNEMVVPQAFLDNFPNVCRPSGWERWNYLSPKSRTFLDFFLLCASKQIISGTSNFANSASEIIGSNRTEWADLLGDNEAKRLVIDYLQADQGDDHLEKTLACDFLLTQIAESLSPQEFVDVVQIGFNLEPSNPAYAIKLAYERIVLNDFRGAQTVLEQSTRCGGLKTLYRLAADWKRGHADVSFEKLVRHGGIIQPEEWEALEENRGKLGILDWWLLAGDLVRRPRDIEFLYNDLKSSQRSSPPTNLEADLFANLFEEALVATPGSSMPPRSNKRRFRLGDVLFPPP